MKKASLLLGLLLIAILVITGCGTPAQTTTSPTATLPPTTTIAPTTSQPITSTTQPSATKPPTSTTVAPTTAPGTGPKYGGTIKWVDNATPSGSIGYPPEILTASTTSIQLVLEGLLREDNKGGMIPWLAEAYKVAADLKSITFNLRKSVKFHDGSDFTAQIAKWNLDNQIAAKTQPTWDTVDVLDDYTIRVNLKTWTNTVLRSFGDGNFSWMISKAAFDKNGLDWVRQNPVGTGPFKFTGFSRDVYFKTVKNENYWAKDANGNKLPYVDAVEVLYVVDPITQKVLMASGGGDMTQVNIGKETADMAAAGIPVQAIPVSVNGLIPDTANADSPWSNQKVREAAEYAIDREAIAKGLGNGYWQATYQIPARAFGAYDPNFSTGRKYDVAKAKQLMIDAGYPNGFKTTIIMNPLTAGRDVVVAIQSYLKVIGIDAALDFPEFSKYQPTYLLGSWKNALLYQVFPGFGNYNATLQTYFTPGSAYLKSWVRTDDFVKAFNATLSSTNPDIGLIRAAFAEIQKTASVIPMNESGKVWAVEPYVMNAGLFERSLSPYWKPEQTWLNR